MFCKSCHGIAVREKGTQDAVDIIVPHALPEEIIGRTEAIYITRRREF